MAFIRQERRVLELSAIQRQLRLYDEHDGAVLRIHKEAGLDLTNESEGSGLTAASDSQKAELPMPSDSQEMELGLPEESFPLSSDSQEESLRRFSDPQELELSHDSKGADGIPKEHSECNLIGWWSKFVFFDWLLVLYVDWLLLHAL